MTAEEMIAKAAEILAREAGPHAKVILFGSHARGSASAGSDLDFLVIEPKVEGRHSEMVRLRRSLRGINAPIDVLVYSEDEARAWGRVPGTAIYDALQEGRVFPGA
jgi:predicted nucleotidyltransferase